MSVEATTSGPIIERLEHHLKIEEYSSSATGQRIASARHFLSYLQEHHVGVDAVEPAHVQEYLEHKLRIYRKRHGGKPTDMSGWRWDHTRGIHLLLRVVKGKWPPTSEATGPQEQARWEMCDTYAQWLADARGLASKTIHNRRAEALHFLDSLAGAKHVSQFTVADLDKHMTSRAPQLKRVTRQHVVTDLRSFLRYLHVQGQITNDLSCALMSTRRYAFEGIPSALRAEHVDVVLKATQKDCTTKGLRDYAILMLLSTYGLRAGEVTGLRLDDLDWRQDRLHIRHSKTGCESFLPLLAPAGEAILKYLQKARPATKSREVFLRVRAPFKSLRSGTSLYHMVEHRLQEAGITLRRKHGPHAFRHALAVSLLHAAVPMKSIGDVLGHRSTASTAVYLKLATSELRTIGLDVPLEVRS